MIGDLVTGRAVESETAALSPGFERESTDGAPNSEYLVDMLRWRASSRPDDQLFSMMDTRVSHILYYASTIAVLYRSAT